MKTTTKCIFHNGFKRLHTATAAAEQTRQLLGKKLLSRYENLKYKVFTRAVDFIG